VRRGDGNGDRKLTQQTRTLLCVASASLPGFSLADWGSAKSTTLVSRGFINQSSVLTFGRAACFEPAGTYSAE
jgi:hypothetical protein